MGTWTRSSAEMQHFIQWNLQQNLVVGCAVASPAIYMNLISLNSYKILQTAPWGTSLLAAFYIKNASLAKAFHLNP